MDLRMKCRQTCQGDPWRMMRPGKKGTVGGRPSAPPTIPFSRAHPPPFPLHFCLHFIRRSMVNHYYFSNAHANANANANAMVIFVILVMVWSLLVHFLHDLF